MNRNFLFRFLKTIPLLRRENSYDIGSIPRIATNRLSQTSVLHYGKSEVSLLAPRVGIYSSLPGDVYKLANSVGFSSGVISGAAAFLKAYFPKLTAVQLKGLLMSNVTSMKGKEVEKCTVQIGKPVVDQYLYEQLCQAAGILNLCNAVEAAVKRKN